MKSNQNVLTHSHAGKDAQVLERSRHPDLRKAMAWQATQLPSSELDASRVWHELENGIEHRRLACSIGSDERMNLAILHCQVE